MRITNLHPSVYRIPTDRPEADGTFTWDATTLVLVEVVAESGERGLGYSYASAAAADVVQAHLAPRVVGQDVLAVGAAWEAMVNAVRNIGRAGVAATAVSAVDIALWDLKARVLGLPLGRLLAQHRTAVPIYGSGGFTSYTEAELCRQLAGWVADGIPRVKMKLGADWGRRPALDRARVRAARRAIGDEAELFVDANGAYTVKQAIAQAEAFAAEAAVGYFEEPVSSDQLTLLAQVRASVRPAIAAGEYGYDPWYFRAMLQAGAVDILQADATRCLGVTGWLQAAALAYAFDVPFSAHTAPSIHAPVGCAAPRLEHVEYFHDHARIEQLLFDGAPRPEAGTLRPDPDRPGLGLTLKAAAAARWRIAA